MDPRLRGDDKNQIDNYQLLLDLMLNIGKSTHPITTIITLTGSRNNSSEHLFFICPVAP